MKKNLSVCFLMHANLQYAEIPPSRIEEVVEQSYIPTLDIFIKKPEVKVVMDFSGVTLEILAKDYPEVIKKLRFLLSQGNVELCGSTYAHPILPIIPLDHAKKQMGKFQAIYNRLFGDLKIDLDGFFPPEYFFDASLIPLFNEFGYNWIPVNAKQYINSIKGNLNNPLKAPVNANTIDLKEYGKLKLFSPLKILGAQESEIDGLIINGDFYEIINDLHDKKMTWDEYGRLLEQINALYNYDGHAFLFLGPSDLEFIGSFSPIHSDPSYMPITPAWLFEFCHKLLSYPELKFETPTKHLETHPPEHKHYLKCGGDNAELDIWTKDPDNLRINLLTEDAKQKIDLAQDRLDSLKTQRYDVGGVSKILEKAWDSLLLAENADGRGWLPIPERRLFCYNQAISAQELAEQALKMMNAELNKAELSSEKINQQLHSLTVFKNIWNKAKKHWIH